MYHHYYIIFNHYDADIHYRIRGFKIKRDKQRKVLNISRPTIIALLCNEISARICSFLLFRDIYHARCGGKAWAKFNYIEYNVFFGKDSYIYGTYYIYDINDNHVTGLRLSETLGKWKENLNVTE